MAGRSIFDPHVPAGAYDEFAVEAVPRSAAQRGWEPSDGPLPTLYIGHGAPPLLDDALWMSQLSADPAALLSLGARLRPLRESGVLLIGSGFLTHGLPFLTLDTMRGDLVPGWSAEFDQWAGEALALLAVILQVGPVPRMVDRLTRCGGCSDPDCLHAIVCTPSSRLG